MSITLISKVKLKQINLSSHLEFFKHHIVAVALKLRTDINVFYHVLKCLPSFLDCAALLHHLVGAACPVFLFTFCPLEIAFDNLSVVVRFLFDAVLSEEFRIIRCLLLLGASAHPAIVVSEAVLALQDL